MFPQRRLLYHRGLDESIGTYVTDYVLTVECLILVAVLLYVRFYKYNKFLSGKNGHTSKSTWAIVALLLAVGIGAFIGGLAHQFLPTVEPYSGPQDALHWVVIWRFAACFSGMVAFSLFVLTEHLVTSEGLYRPHPYVYRGYYFFASLFSLALVIHSFWMVAHPTNPWSLTITFVLIFFVAVFEWIVSFVVLVKRFRSSSSVVDNTYEIVDKDLSTASNGTDETSINKSRAKLHPQASLEPLNNNIAPSNVRRWDLLMYFVGTLVFLLGGGIQIVFARFFNCSNHVDPASQGCPLPNSFNHNSVFHVFQIFAMAAYFVAEIFAYYLRIRLSEKLELSA